MERGFSGPVTIIEPCGCLGGSVGPITNPVRRRGTTTMSIETAEHAVDGGNSSGNESRSGETLAKVGARLSGLRITFADALKVRQEVMGGAIGEDVDLWLEVG